MMSAKAGKRPLRSLTAHEKLEAIRRVHDGESKASVARDIGVPESTLRGWCKNEEKISYISRQSSPDTDDSLHGGYEPKDKKLKLGDDVSPFNLSLKASSRLSYSPGSDAGKYASDYIKVEDKPLNLNIKSEQKSQMSEREKNRAELARLSMEFGLNRPEIYSSLGGALADLSSNIGLLTQWNNLFLNQQQQKPSSSSSAKKVTAAQADTSSNSITSTSAPLLTTFKTESGGKDKSAKLPKLDPQKSAEDAVWYWLSMAQNQNMGLGNAASTTNGLTNLQSTAASAAAQQQQNSTWWKWYKQYTQVSQQLATQTQHLASTIPPQQTSPLQPKPSPPPPPPPAVEEPKPILYQQLTKEAPVAPTPPEITSAAVTTPVTSNSTKKARAVLDNLLNNNNLSTTRTLQEDEEDDLPTQSEALEHGEKFLRWLEYCSEPSVTAMQIMQFRGLINNIKSGADRRNGDTQKAKVRRK